MAPDFSDREGLAFWEKQCQDTVAGTDGLIGMIIVDLDGVRLTSTWRWEDMENDPDQNSQLLAEATSTALGLLHHLHKETEDWRIGFKINPHHIMILPMGKNRVVVGICREMTPLGLVYLNLIRFRSGLPMDLKSLYP